MNIVMCVFSIISSDEVKNTLMAPLRNVRVGFEMQKFDYET